MALGLQVKPLCPWCGEPVSDSPLEDFGAGDNFIECAECGGDVVVTPLVSVEYNVRKDEE